MSTAFSPSPAPLGLSTAHLGSGSDLPRLRSRFDGSRGLAARLVEPARQLARRALAVLRAWTQALAEARAEQRLWHAAHRDPRLMADLMQAGQRDLDTEPNGRQPWGRFPERLSDGREQQIHLNHP
jgi:hypothetical protein